MSSNPLPAALPRTATRDRLGIMLALIGPGALGLAIAVSRFAYQGGTNGLTVTSARVLLALAGLYAVCKLRSRSLVLPLRDWFHVAGLGVLLVLMTYGNVGSVEYISVGLAALLFYTFPPLIALIHACVLGERLAPAKLIAVAAAFIGICIMLGVSFGSSDWRGVALALSAAGATAWNAVWLARKLAGADLLVVTLHMTLVALPLILLLTWMNGGLVLPDEARGWFGLVAVALLQAGALPIYFIAISRIGSLNTAVFSNIQPVTSIVAAYLLFGETLTHFQLAGGIIVLAGIYAMQRSGRNAP